MRPRSVALAVCLLIALPTFAQSDLTGTWTGSVTLSSSRSGCPPFSVTGNASLAISQSGTDVSGTFNSDVSEQNLISGCSANGGPASVQFSGTVSGNTVTINASGITGTVTVNGNTISGALNGFGDTVTLALTKSGTSSGACNLGITISCDTASCTTTTINNGSNTCSGEFITAILINDPQNRGTVTNFTTTLPLSGSPECFDNGNATFAIGFGLGVCVGNASLDPGASFTSHGQVGLAGADPSTLLGATLVDDPISGQPLTEAYTFNSVAPVATCTPQASVPQVTQTGIAYNVTWSAVTEPNPTYTVDESTTPDFSSNVSSQPANTRSATFHHSVATTYYYRVRANVCNGAPGANSPTVSIVVQAIPTITGRQGDAVAPLGSTAPVSMKVFIPGQPSGGTFTASVDKPYLTVTPAGGTLPTGGTTVTVTANPADLPPGASTGTLTVTTSSSATGNIKTNGTTTTSTSVSVSLVTPVTPAGKTLPPPNSMIIPAVAHAPGALGPFQSDVRLTNASSGQTSYQVTYTPTQTDARQTSKTTTVNVGAGQTIALNDILKDFFGVGATDAQGDAGQGTLEIRPLNSASSLNYAASRTFTFNANGTFGQFIAAIPFSQFATKASIVPLPGQPPVTATPTLSLQQVACCTGQFRTNLGLVEGSGAAASGNIKLYDDNGILQQTVPYSLQPGEHIQKFLGVNGWGFPNVSDGRIEVTVESSTGAVTAYASVLDNTTNDPLEVTPVQVSQVSATRYVLPGMAELNNGASNFHSDIRLYNGGSTAVTVTPTFYSQIPSNPPRSAAPFSIGPGQVAAFNAAVITMFHADSDGGSVVFTTDAPSSLVATGRTYTIDPNNVLGTYGQFIPGITPSQGIGTGDRPLQILQLEESANFRSNMGLAELTGNSATVHITAYVPDSKTTVSADVPLAPNQFYQQRILASLFPGQNIYNARISVQVTGGNGRVAAYGSVIDNASLDPTYVPAQ